MYPFQVISIFEWKECRCHAVNINRGYFQGKTLSPASSAAPGPLPSGLLAREDLVLY